MRGGETRGSDALHGSLHGIELIPVPGSTHPKEHEIAVAIRASRWQLPQPPWQ
jgi:hypothetical protein